LVDSGDTFGHPRSEGRRETATMNKQRTVYLAAEGASEHREMETELLMDKAKRSIKTRTTPSR